MTINSIHYYDYDLPDSLIAQFPPEKRGDSRLLIVETKPENKPENNAAKEKTVNLQDRHFNDLIDYLAPGDLLVLNNTRVLPARIMANKETGGQCEILVERILTTHQCLVQMRASKSPKPGQKICVNEIPLFLMKERRGRFFVLELIDTHTTVLDILEKIGNIPLPPYIERSDDQKDHERYQTVFAKQKGAVAAPTASLHFTEAMLEKLKQKGIKLCEITLHVGSGTFQPVQCEHLDEHIMHYEWVQVSQDVVDQINQTKHHKGRIIAVGTTVTRALETAALKGTLQPFEGDTNLFIREGFTFKVVDALLTNFHLPKSTLLVLVSSFIGRDTIKNAYAHAIEKQYRFFSYGDAMLLLPNNKKML